MRVIEFSLIMSCPKLALHDSPPASNPVYGDAQIMPAGFWSEGILMNKASSAIAAPASSAPMMIFLGSMFNVLVSQLYVSAIWLTAVGNSFSGPRSAQPH